MRKKNQISWNNYLPLELEREILARLPVKTLLQFRCVSKSWCSLIDCPYFKSLHFNRYNNNNNSTNNPKFIAIHEFHHNYTITLRRIDSFRRIGAEIANFDRNIHHFSLRQICKGVFLIRHNLMMKLWNPSIRKCLIIPYSPILVPDYFVRYKLGFAPSSNDYKVVAIKPDVGITAIYSVNDHRWRGLPAALQFDYEKRVVVSGGAMYWVMSDQSEERTSAIGEFDFDSEELRLVQPPDAVKESTVWFIFRYGESIAVFTMSPENNCIWGMEKKNNGGRKDDVCNWRLWFLGKPNPNPKTCSLFMSIKTEILYVQKTNTFVMVDKSSIKDRVMSYNVINHRIKHLAKSLYSEISFNTYVESLVLHKGVEGQNLASFP